jgi:hypothetical protein
VAAHKIRVGQGGKYGPSDEELETAMEQTRRQVLTLIGTLAAVVLVVSVLFIWPGYLAPTLEQKVSSSARCEPPVRGGSAPYCGIVVFFEKGLPVGTNWSVTIGGRLGYSTTSAISFREPKGTYDFFVAPADGLRPTPSAGSVTVPGGPSMVDITFGPVTPPPSIA